MIDFINSLIVIRCLSALSGVAVYIHFICKANFTDAKKTPFLFIFLISLIASCSISIIYFSIVFNEIYLMFSFLSTVFIWFLLDLLMWYYGYPINRFFHKARLK